VPKWRVGVRELWERRVTIEQESALEAIREILDAERPLHTTHGEDQETIFLHYLPEEEWSVYPAEPESFVHEAMYLVESLYEALQQSAPNDSILQTPIMVAARKWLYGDGDDN